MTDEERAEMSRLQTWKYIAIGTLVLLAQGVLMATGAWEWMLRLLP